VLGVALRLLNKSFKNFVFFPRNTDGSTTGGSAPAASDPSENGLQYPGGTIVGFSVGVAPPEGPQIEGGPTTRRRSADRICSFSGLSSERPLLKSGVEDVMSLSIVLKSVFLSANKPGGEMTPPDIHGGIKFGIPTGAGTFPVPKRLLRSAAFFPMKMLGSTNGDTIVGFTGRNGFKFRYGLIGLAASLTGTVL